MRRFGQPRLEAHRAVSFQMQAWRRDRGIEAHAVVEQIDRDLEDRGSDAVGAAGAERSHVPSGCKMMVGAIMEDRRASSRHCPRPSSERSSSPSILFSMKPNLPTM